MAGFSVRYGSTWTWTSVIPGTGRGTQGARKAFSSLPERSVRTREFSDHFLIVPIRSRTRRSVRVQQDVLAWVRIAEGEDRRRDGAAAGTVHAEADAARSRGVRAQGSLERPNHLLGIEGDLREDPLDELHLRIGRNVPALVRQDVQALVPSGHRELAVVPKEADLLLRCDEEVPEVVLVLTHFSLEEHVDASHVRLPQCVQHQLPARTGRGGGASAPVRQGHDEARPARADPRPAGLAVPWGDDDRRAFDHGGRVRGSARGFVPVHADDEIVARDRLPDPDEGAHWCSLRLLEVVGPHLRDTRDVGPSALRRGFHGPLISEDRRRAELGVPRRGCLLAHRLGRVEQILRRREVVPERPEESPREEAL